MDSRRSDTSSARSDCCRRRTPLLKALYNAGRLCTFFGFAAAAACSSEPTRASETPAPSTSQQIPIGQLPAIDADAVLAHTKVLASDEYEGRAPGTKGEDLTVRYLVDQFKKMGLEPGNSNGTYVQKVPLVGITPEP